MPRYFFHIRGRPDAREDVTGIELADTVAARNHAQRLARDLLGRAVIEGEPPSDERIEVEDEEQRIVLLYPHLSDAAPS
jgi:hypothetical protein